LVSIDRQTGKEFRVWLGCPLEPDAQVLYERLLRLLIRRLWRYETRSVCLKFPKAKRFCFGFCML
jgi:hypothetical protein